MTLYGRVKQVKIYKLNPSTNVCRPNVYDVMTSTRCQFDSLKLKKFAVYKLRPSMCGHNS